MPSEYELTSNFSIVIEECIECGTRFGISKIHWKYLHDNKVTFYCPNGHNMAYTKSEAELVQERMKKEADALRDRAELKARQARLLAEGTCPLCGKKYKGIVSHMKKKHPTFS